MTVRSMEPDLESFVASDGYRLHLQRWIPPGSELRGRVIVLHGIQSHSGWYEYSSARMCSAGFEVVFPDRRGSGRNAIDRGHADHQDRLINDVVQILLTARHDTPRVPVTLLGVSWGGKLAAVIAARRPELVDRLGLLYPGICPRIRPRWYQVLMLSLVLRLGMRRRLVDLPLNDAALFTDEPAWREWIENDPHVLRSATLSFVTASRALDRLVMLHSESISCPCLLMLAGRDRIADNIRVRAFFSRVRSSDRKIIEYAAARHTLEFEPNRAQIFDDLIAWLSRPCAGVMD